MRKFTKMRGILTLLALSLVASFAVGCGDSESFVFTGPVRNANPAETGNLQFRFNTPVAQTAADLPEGTTQLFFSLHTGNPPSTTNLNAAIGPVAVSSLNDDGTYVLEGVDPDVNTVVVVARSADGFPLAAWQATGIEVVLGDTVLVDLGDAEPITFEVVPSPNPLRMQRDRDPAQLGLTLNFSNGSSITLNSYNTPEVTFTGVDPTVANFTTTGQFSAISGVGNTGTNDTATVTYDLLGLTDDADFGIQVFRFELVSPGSYGSDSLEPGNEGAGWGFSALFTGPDGVTEPIVHDFDEADPNLSFAIEPANVGVSFNSSNEIEVASTATVGTPFAIIVTYTDPDTGFPVTLSLDFEVEDTPD